MRTRWFRAAPARSAPRLSSGCGGGPAKSFFAFQVCRRTLITGAQLNAVVFGIARPSTMKSMMSPFSTVIPFNFVSALDPFTDHEASSPCAAGDDAAAHAVAVRHGGLAMAKRSFDTQIFRTRDSSSAGSRPGSAARPGRRLSACSTALPKPWAGRQRCRALPAVRYEGRRKA